MNDKSSIDKIDYDSFEELKNAYNSNLPLSINIISDDFKALLESKLDHQEYSVLRTAVHKLAGSAGSFGYTDMSNILKGIDQYLSGLPDADALTGKINKEYILNSIKEIKHIIKQAGKPQEGVPTQ